MNHLMPPSGDDVQSFVLRVWEEEPGRQRGTIRHVQSQTQRGFTKLSQALEFVEHYLPVLSSGAAREQTSSRSHSLLSGSWLRMPRYQMATLAAGLLLVFVFGIFSFAPEQGSNLVGTAVDIDNLADGVVFLGGVLAGVLLTLIWQKAKS